MWMCCSKQGKVVICRDCVNVTTGATCACSYRTKNPCTAALTLTEVRAMAGRRA